MKKVKGTLGQRCIGELSVSNVEAVIKTMSDYCGHDILKHDFAQGKNEQMKQTPKKCFPIQTINKFQLINKYKKNEVKKVIIEPAIEKYIFSWHMKVMLEKYNHKLLLSGINKQVRI